AKAGLVPTLRVAARVELFLQRAQKPAFGLAGRVGAVEVGQPLVVAHDDAPLAARKIDRKMEEESRLAPGPCAVACAVKQHLDAERIGALLEERSQIDGVYIQLPRIRWRRPPSGAIPVGGEPVAAVRRDQRCGTQRLRREIDFAAE